VDRLTEEGQVGGGGGERRDGRSRTPDRDPKRKKDAKELGEGKGGDASSSSAAAGQEKAKDGDQ
jgi:hypothetical protein